MKTMIINNEEKKWFSGHVFRSVAIFRAWISPNAFFYPIKIQPNEYSRAGQRATLEYVLRIKPHLTLDFNG